jgi:hypothetical protein|tara:strand:- start:2380 stop:2889 length:510 start_codon:yes stop_codon:yes gene_type:complete
MQTPYKDVTVIQDFLPLDIYEKINQTVMGNNFPWFFNSNVSSDLKPDSINDFIFFHHLYASDGIKSNFFNTILMPILGKLNFNYIIRSKINLYTRKEKQLQHDFHIDQEKEHMVALYSVNTNNGSTVFENGKKILSVANQVIIFNGNLNHASCVQTDKQTRVNININFI